MLLLRVTVMILLLEQPETTFFMAMLAMMNFGVVLATTPSSVVKATTFLRVVKATMSTSSTREMGKMKL